MNCHREPRVRTPSLPPFLLHLYGPKIDATNEDDEEGGPAAQFVELYTDLNKFLTESAENQSSWLCLPS